MTAAPPPPAPRYLGHIVLVRSLTKAQIGEPRAYFNARYLLDAAAAAPIPATKKLGNLTRAFVERAFAEMHWQADEAEMVRFHNKAIDEPDLGSLWLLRVAAQNGGLLRKYRGAFTTTRRGRELLMAGREGELYAALFESYFEKTRLAFLDGYPDDPWLQQQVPQILWLLHSAPAGALTVGEIAAEVVVDKTLWTDRPWASAFEQLCDTVAHRLLRHMEDFGLVTMASRPTGLDRYRPWPERPVQVTPLFTRFVAPAPGSPRFN